MRVEEPNAEGGFGIRPDHDKVHEIVGIWAIVVRNWWSTSSFDRDDIGDFVIIEDRPVSVVQDFLRRRSQSPVLTYAVLKDGATHPSA